jgi:predicted Zn finger-like uncharacterized protein
MIITCKNCNTSFNLRDELIKATGSNVKCSKCNNIFQVFPPFIENEPDVQPSDLSMEPEKKADPKPYIPSDQQQAEKNKFPHKPDAGGDLDLSEIEKILQEEDGKTFDGDTLERDEHQGDFDDFEFDELDDFFGKDDDLVENLSETDTEPKGSDLEFDFDFDFEKEETSALSDAEEVEDAEDIDLSELDDLFGKDENQSLKSSASFQDLDAMSQDDDEILSMDIPDDEGEISLDDGSDKKAEEINLSEIDEFFPNETDDEIDFDFDLDLEMEKDPVDDLKDVKSPEDLELDYDFNDYEKKENITGFDEEFDLSDLEEIIDLEEESEVDTKSLKSKNIDENEELEFDLALEPDINEGTSLTVFLEEESNPESSEKAVETESDYSEKFEDTQFDMDEYPEDTEDTRYDMDENREEAFLTEKDDYNLEEPAGKNHKVFNTVTLPDTMRDDETDHDDMSIEDEEIKSKNGFGKMVLAAVVLLLLAAAGYGAFTGFNMSVSQIPIIGSFTITQTPDPGNLKLIALDLNSKFDENRHAGKIFIITGTIKNEYTEPRSFIKITGKLYEPAKRLSQTEQVYAGNMFSELELRSLDMEAIKNRLNNRFGQNSSNVNIQPGQSVPFMIIFSKLPQQLEEFEVLIESSSPA